MLLSYLRNKNFSLWTYFLTSVIRSETRYSLFDAGVWTKGSCCKRENKSETCVWLCLLSVCFLQIMCAKKKNPPFLLGSVLLRSVTSRDFKKYQLIVADLFCRVTLDWFQKSEMVYFFWQRWKLEKLLLYLNDTLFTSSARTHKVIFFFEFRLSWNPSAYTLIGSLGFNSLWSTL